MTLAQYTTTRKQYEYLNNGQFLSMLIIGVLDNMDLSMLQASSLDDIKGGSFNPRDKVMYKSVLEVLELASTDKIDTLISNLKRLPSPNSTADSIIYLLDGKPCTRGVYFSADRDLLDGRWKEGTPRPKRSRANAPKMSEEAFQQIQENFKERWAKKEEPIIHTPRETPVAKRYEPTDKPIYRDIGDDENIETLTTEQEFSHNEDSKPWNNGRGDRT